MPPCVPPARYLGNHQVAGHKAEMELLPRTVVLGEAVFVGVAHSPLPPSDGPKVVCSRDFQGSELEEHPGVGLSNLLPT